jgi:hypothetical protein
VGYTLTDASALGFDLVRTPGGADVAGVLLRGLLAPADPGRLPVRAPADLAVARTRATALLGPAVPTVVDLRAVEQATGSLPGGGGGSSAALRRTLRRLGALTFGTAADLQALAGDLAGAGAPGPGAAGDDSSLRVLGAAEAERGEVLADAVLAALVGRRSEPAALVLARTLNHRLDPPPPEPAGLPPAPPPGTALLVHQQGSALVRSTAHLLGRVAAVRDPSDLLVDGPSPEVWAEHMHEATWAVETTGRTLTAAVAQLDLVRCLDAAGVDAATCTGGVWRSCSAAVQAHVVGDVLGAGSWTALTADLLDALPR